MVTKTLVLLRYGINYTSKRICDSSPRGLVFLNDFFSVTDPKAR